MSSYELFSHPSEQGIRGKGSTISEAFEEIAKAMESVMVEIERIQGTEKREINLENPDKETLLIEWLNEILYLFDVDGLVFKDFKVNIKNSSLKAKARGENFDPNKHGSGTIVKAATYDELKVEKKGDEWIAQCIVDV